MWRRPVTAVTRGWPSGSDGLGDPGLGFSGGLRLQALAGLAPAGLADAVDAGDQRVPGLLGLVAEAGHVLDPPLPEHHRHEDLPVVDGEVVDAGLGYGACMGVEVDDAGAGHLEVTQLALDGED